MGRKIQPTNPPRKSGAPERADARSNEADAAGKDRRRRGSGEGSASALANLKTIQRNIDRSRPTEDPREPD